MATTSHTIVWKGKECAEFRDLNPSTSPHLEQHRYPTVVCPQTPVDSPASRAHTAVNRHDSSCGLGKSTSSPGLKPHTPNLRFKDSTVSLYDTSNVTSLLSKADRKAMCVVMSTLYHFTHSKLAPTFRLGALLRGDGQKVATSRLCDHLTASRTTRTEDSFAKSAPSTVSPSSKGRLPFTMQTA